ncbi:MAG: isoprenylcysteine carboxylmethyltransferase family protein [Candidatus Roizmanbacteria bacterium]|nr:isoprenylcysteine carboxylmethyltransferase family protein [Candidatus Roizmanbacteria bacterium]
MDLHQINILNFGIRFASLSFFIIWKYYWHITEKIADREKPKSDTYPKITFLRRESTTIIGIFILLQLIGWEIFPMPENPAVQVIGMLLVGIGVTMAISARKSLGTNWNHAFEYQIKKKHKLITHGIYAYVRHPIYAGLILSYLGIELVVESYLFIPFFIITVTLGIIQCKREEKILSKYFGEEYTNYMKRTKMLVPLLF